MIIEEQTIREQIKGAVKQIDPTAIAILYGSRATGKAKNQSDWDILILVNKSFVSLGEERKFRHSLYDLELVTGESFSTFVYTMDYWDTMLAGTPIYKTITKEGIVL